MPTFAQALETVIAIHASDCKDPGGSVRQLRLSLARDLWQSLPIGSWQRNVENAGICCADPGREVRKGDGGGSALTGFLGSLFRYRATEGRTPAEDFFTEALSGVLASDDGETAAAFASWLAEDEFERAWVVTQKVVDEGRLDMEFEARDAGGGRHLVVLENKLGATEGENQLARYECYLARQEEAAGRTLVYLTRYEKPDWTASSERVSFMNLHWSDVYDWLTAWVERRGDRTGVLGRELLVLMEEWGMEMGLGAQDLAAAVAYKTRVQPQLLQILDRVWAECKKDCGTGSQWNYDRNRIRYSSAYLEDSDLYYMFGFDFTRSDGEWNASRLQLPSAYFAICGKGLGERDWSGLSAEWGEPPRGWTDWTNERVRQLATVRTDGASLHQSYLGFFLESLEEAR